MDGYPEFGDAPFQPRSSDCYPNLAFGNSRLVLCTGPSCRHGTTSIGGCTGMRSESVPHLCARCEVKVVIQLQDRSSFHYDRVPELERCPLRVFQAPSNRLP